MIGEACANETSGEYGLALAGSLVGESQLRIPKLETDIIFSNRVPLVSVELESCNNHELYNLWHNACYNTVNLSLTIQSL